MRLVLFLTAVILMAVCVLCPAMAAPVTLYDGNSTFTVDPTGNSGATLWTLDGINQLYQQQWYYRLYPDGPVNSINCLGTPMVVSDTNRVRATYAQQSYTVDLEYLLYGGSAGSGHSDVSEIFRINNFGTADLYFDLFEYSDFNLQPDKDDDSAVHVNSNFVQQTDATTTLMVSESVVRTPDHWYVGQPMLITTDLPDNAAAYGPADCAWAFQWNLNVPAGGTVVFSKDKAFSTNVIPEPMSVVLGVLGLAAVGGFRRLRVK